MNRINEKSKINFIIPDFLNVEECVYFLDTFRNHFEIYKDEVNLLGFCGVLPSFPWNEEDKRFGMYKLKIEVIQNLKNKYNKLGIPLFLVFDKVNISVKDLENEYANKIMSIFDDSKNYVICKSKRLVDYIRETYKRINIIPNYDEYKNQDTEYFLVDPELNDSKEIFEISKKQKIILYADGNMIPNKRWLFKHTKKDSVLNKINPKKDKYYTKKSFLSFYEMKQQDNYLSYDKLIEYSKNGVNTFILSGFGVYNVALVENIVDYLFKEEYKRDQRLNIWYKNKILIEQEELAINNYEL